jgi:hypothetical protein
VALAAWQLLSGLGNVLLGWPLAAALAHTGGAAGLAVTLTLLLMRARPLAERATLPPGAPSAPGWLRRMQPAQPCMSDALAQTPSAGVSLLHRLRQFYVLTKPRVVQLIVSCAVIGMLLATRAGPTGGPWRRPLSASGSSPRPPPPSIA